jgi:RNA 2',3'-cyclic 3'-phosphodiesterase
VRAFVAVEVPREAEEVPRESPLAPDHLTLLFLGETAPTTADDLERALAPALAHVPSFEFVLEGVGAFPSPARPRVVWRGVGRGTDALGALARVVRETVASVTGTSDPSPFVPHVTLFRVRSSRDRERAARMLAEGAPSPPPTTVPVRSVDLVESTLRPAGAQHRTRARFPLAVS